MGKALRLVLLCCICPVLAGCSLTGNDMTLELRNGLVSGVRGNDPSVMVFKGIPYAAPPVFDLRWRPPQAPLSWDGVRKADRFAPVCMQHGRGWGEFYQEEFYPRPEPMSEDCLYLNVWTTKAKGQPVFVWFHGGAFREGSGSLPSFDGEKLAQKGVVVVTLNFRLGVFGFLAHPDLSKEAVSGTSGNYGLLDMIAALQWVQKNIELFGGDPNRVTIAGQSGGARAVHYLEGSPLARNLFHRAIAQSGSSILRVADTRSLPQAEEAGREFGAQLGAKSLGELRGKPGAALMEADFRAFQPNIDGWVLKDDVYGSFTKGKQNDVPMLTGINSEEQIGFLPETVASREFRAGVTENYGELAQAFFQLYPAGSDQEAKQSRDNSMRDQTILAMRSWARMRSRTSKTPLYVYYFSRKPPGRDSRRMGAFHSAEIEFVFGTLKSTKRPWGPVDEHLSDLMSSYWVNFATTGNPNGAALPHWPLYGENTDLFMELGDNLRPRNVMPDKAKQDFFERVFAGKLPATPQP
jgi:para-nitrobenzyl esterase